MSFKRDYGFTKTSFNGYWLSAVFSGCKEVVFFFYNEKLSQQEAVAKNLKTKQASNTDFKLFEFINTRTKSKYICKIHDLVYETLPTNFWGGHGCPKCGQAKRVDNPKKKYIMQIRKSNSQIISEFQKIHGKFKYDYSEINYTKNNIKIPIKCKNPEHGIFFQTPNKHLLGRGCPLCANENRNLNTKRSLNEFISLANKVHNNFYDYSESIYKGALSFIDVICPTHGKFQQKVNDHLNGRGCKYCAHAKNAEKLLKSTTDIIPRLIEVHGDFYDYSKVNYEGVLKPITIICPIHKEFKQIANAHLNGSGCPKCKKSKGEKLISKILDHYSIKSKEQYKFQECKFKQPLPFDFYLLEFNVCIEYQGIQHYIEKKHWGGKKAFDYLNNNDKIKSNYCKKNKITLIHIPYTIPSKKVENFLIEKLIGIIDFVIN